MNAAKVVEDLKQRFPNTEISQRAGVHPGRKSGTAHH